MNSQVICAHLSNDKCLLFAGSIDRHQSLSVLDGSARDDVLSLVWPVVGASCMHFRSALFLRMLTGSWSGYSCTLYLQFIQLWSRGFFGYGSFNQWSPSHVVCSKFESFVEDWKVLKQSWKEHWMFEPLAISFLLRAYIIMRMRRLIILFESTSEDAMAAVASLHHHKRMRWLIICSSLHQRMRWLLLIFFCCCVFHDTSTVERLRKCSVRFLC